ncbi:NAD-dependent epimerase/dehydratase family protein [Arthrobacter caoxuetaonis]|uniref:NAD-dependent epimerase/dehydratase family protein n=1 Tax=Arthrobacter caoxuetaonis TaxID=2886935 RepID=UPI001D140B3F|nr:NAD-dependent epimerase/dehydratase family protein [Arthrobacter caoxuetaonis]MCC3280885.1 NAD-dependent epimerase/dehydratase family protein [Arthrobacter caoxuetaonis]
MNPNSPIDPASEPVWAVLGASGFIGSALQSTLASRGITVRYLKAPRLTAVSTDAAGILAEAAVLENERLDLAGALAGAEVVINAAGLATPSGTDSPALRGANALLPVLVADAADAAGVRRFVHLSSAAVQGHRPFLDESSYVQPFSAYSRSKALGEAALAARTQKNCGVVTIRATSVQGPERQTTLTLVRVAASPLASVAGRGEAPTPVSSVHALTEFTATVASYDGEVPSVVLQPWEGATVADVLRAAGGREPKRLPRWFCRASLKAGYAVSSLLGERFHGPLRRLEMMWFGQRQEPGWAEAAGKVPAPRVAQVLDDARTARQRVDPAG